MSGYSRWTVLTVRHRDGVLKVVVPLVRHGDAWMYRFPDGQQLLLYEHEAANSPLEAQQRDALTTVGLV